MTDMNSIEKLLQRRQPQERVNRMWREIAAVTVTLQNRQPKVTGIRFLAWVGAAVAVAVAALVFLLPGSDFGPLKTKEGAPIPTVLHAEKPLVQEFSDGSVVALEKQSEIHLVKSSDDVVRFSLRKGRTRFDIKPGGPRRWEVDCGDVLVTVLGTAFVIDKDNLHTAVHVERGLVRISGKGVQNGETKLAAGDSIVVEREIPPTAPETIEAIEVQHLSGVAAADEPHPLTAVADKEAITPKGATNRAVVASCDESFATLGPDGFAEQVRLSKRADELFCLADAARKRGHYTEAAAPLNVLVERFREDERAGLAAYTLGRLYLERLSSPQKALRAFEEADSLGVPEALREVLLAKKIKTLRLLGDLDAEKLAAEYTLRYPNGRYLNEFKPREKDK